MAKLVGMLGTGSGRVGNMVLAKRDGLTIARAYQPQVANPKTELQQRNRSRLKLSSQVSSIVAPAVKLAIKGAKFYNVVSELYGKTMPVVGQPTMAILQGARLTGIGGFGQLNVGVMPAEETFCTFQDNYHALVAAQLELNGIPKADLVAIAFFYGVKGINLPVIGGCKVCTIGDDGRAEGVIAIPAIEAGETVTGGAGIVVAHIGDVESYTRLSEVYNDTNTTGAGSVGVWSYKSAAELIDASTIVYAETVTHTRPAA